MYNLFGPDAVAPVIASKEGRLGYLASECIVAVRVGGLGVGCVRFTWTGRSCAFAGSEGGSLRASHLGVPCC